MKMYDKMEDEMLTCMNMITMEQTTGERVNNKFFPMPEIGVGATKSATKSPPPHQTLFS